MAGNVVGKPALRSLGHVSRGRILLEDIRPSFGNSVHSGLHCDFQYLDVFAGLHSEAPLEGPTPSEASLRSHTCHKLKCPDIVKAKGRLSTLVVDVLGTFRHL